MTRKELKVIFKALDAAQGVIEELCCEDYPKTDFADPEFRHMFYALNDMCLKTLAKLKEVEVDA